METAVKLCLSASGVFLLTGLATGTWKYLRIVRSRAGRAHRYVSVAHLASLAYAFASLVLSKFAEYSPYSPEMTLAAATVAVSFFAAAIAAYLVHGLARDTENQFQPPYPLLGRAVPRPAFHSFMGGLVVGEFFGVGLLFWGFLRTQVFTA